MVATDIAARGIHIDEVALVVHFDPPVDHKAYLHRSGRTARAGAEGTVVTMMTNDQSAEVADLTRKAGIRPTITRVTPSHPLLKELAPGIRTFVDPPSPAADPSRSQATGVAGAPSRSSTNPGNAGASSRAKRRPGNTSSQATRGSGSSGSSGLSAPGQHAAVSLGSQPRGAHSPNPARDGVRGDSSRTNPGQPGGGRPNNAGGARGSAVPAGRSRASGRGGRPSGGSRRG